MPLVHVHYKPDAVVDLTAAYLTQAIKQGGVVRFSSGRWPLTVDDFTVIFHEPGPWDQLTNDVVVDYHLHAFPDRVDDADSNAKGLAAYFTQRLQEALPGCYPRLSVGVALQHVEMGWGTAVMTEKE